MVVRLGGYGECGVNHPGRAIEAFTMAQKLSPGDSPTIAALEALGYAYGLAGRSEKALEVLRQLEEIGRQRYVAAHARAFVHLGLNNIEEALDAVEEMVRERSDYLIYVGQHVAFDPLRGEPRFIAALQRVRGEQLTQTRNGRQATA